MFKDFPLFPEQVSTIAPKIDELYFFLVAVSGLMTILIAAAVIYFAVRFRRRPGNEVPVEFKEPKLLEITWIVVPFIVFMVIFVWGAQVYFEAARPPDNAIDVFGTGKRWMWKFQHMNGTQEINELHVPVNTPVRVILTSEDVIHSFFVPVFRVHTDVLPKRYTVNWFNATKPGTYDLFCSEYCGTEHSLMIGKVHVMEVDQYQAWLSGGATQGTPAAEGEKLFTTFACNTCHMAGVDGAAAGRGPDLTHVAGSTVLLQNGQRVVADENYLRESILRPQAKLVAGYQPIMPTFEGQLTETQIMQLIAYIKSLGAPSGEAAAAPATTADPGASPGGSAPSANRVDQINTTGQVNPGTR